jgi:hypothetical protein
MLAPWQSVSLRSIIDVEATQGGREMWKPSVTQRSGLAADKQHEETSVASRSGLSKSFFGLVAGAVVLVVLGFSASAASSGNQAVRGSKAFHATKDCSGFTGLIGAYCTIRSSNVKALKVGSKIFYVQEAGKTALDSDTIIYVQRGTVATGHCFLSSAGPGLCTMSDGTGTLAGFRLRVRVTTDASVPGLFHWDGSYSFNRG